MSVCKTQDTGWKKELSLRKLQIRDSFRAGVG